MLLIKEHLPVAPRIILQAESSCILFPAALTHFVRSDEVKCTMQRFIFC